MLASSVILLSFSTHTYPRLPSVFKEPPADDRGLRTDRRGTQWSAQVRCIKRRIGMEKCGRLKRTFRDPLTAAALLGISRKEVIQPQVPLLLPFYDFAPVTEFAFGRSLPRVGARTSGTPSFHGVTGGVYKARERIHRDVADSRLLAIPTSCSRVADYNPNLDRLFGIRSPSRGCSPLYRPL